MIDRSIAPVFGSIQRIELTEPKQFQLSNGIPVYIFEDKQVEVLRIELIFSAGIWHQTKNLISRFTNELLTEGTAISSSYEIAERIDILGSYLIGSIESDSASLSLYALARNLSPSLAILSEVLEHANFPEPEFRTLVDKRRQEFIINQNKVSYMARKAFLSNLFGPNHPYSSNTTMEDYNQLARKDLINFFQQKYQHEPFQMIVSGKIPDNLESTLEQNFGYRKFSMPTAGMINHESMEYKPDRIQVEKEDSLQSAIRIGMRSVNREDSDFPALQLLNVIYGGYFGSRLMKNIREDKAYTYGINSYFTHLKHASYWNIASEVGTKFTEDTINQCLIEFKKLKQDSIGEEELTRVKNYIKGRFQRNFDGVFSIAESFKSLLINGLTFDYISQSIQNIETLTKVELLEAANKHWNEDQLIIVSAGSH